MKTILTIFGTRPEAIKMAPLIRLLGQDVADFRLVNCVTAQHRQMLDQVLCFFEIRPDIDLNLMRPDQSLAFLTAEAVRELATVLTKVRPDLVLVQGDTTTAFVAALAAFYQKTSVGHVEAGLRTDDLYAPFPEEANRRLVGVLADLHFAPTERSANALRKEGVGASSIHVTGNTVVDALLEGLNRIEKNGALSRQLDEWFVQHVDPTHMYRNGSGRMVSITGHRRESFGEGFQSICSAIRSLAEKYKNHLFVYPVHLNPNVRKPVHECLGGLPNVKLIEPVGYPEMLCLMKRSSLILTDSGGIQEEAPTLKIPVLVMRDKTERPEGIEWGCSHLVGTREESIIEKTSAFLDRRESDDGKHPGNPYGDGRASERIVKIVREFLGTTGESADV